MVPSNTSGLLQTDETFSPFAPALGFAATAGRCAIVMLTTFAVSGSIAGVAVGGTPGTKVADETVPGGTESCEIWLVQDIAASNSNLSVTWASGSRYISAVVLEYVEPLLVDTGRENSATGTSNAPSVATALPTSDADSVVAAVATISELVADVGYTQPSGWDVAFLEDNSEDHISGCAAFNEEGATGTKTATFGMTASHAWAAVIAAFVQEASDAIAPIAATHFRRLRS